MVIVCSPSNVVKHISFSVTSDLNSLDYVLSAYEALNQPWIPLKDWLQFKIALAEGFTNAVRHAHKYLPSSTLIDIQIYLSTQCMSMCIWDYGPPFDFQQFVSDLVNSSYRQNELADHGQGIPVLYKISDHLSYTRTEDNRNYLLVVKQFSAN